MKNLYETPRIDLILMGEDIITASPTVPDFGEGDNELPKQDW